MRSFPLVALSSFLIAAVGCSRSPGAQSAGSDKNDACPDAVKQSATRAIAGATMAGCRRENQQGRDVYEVKLESGARKVEIDLAPDGTILQTEEPVALEDVPTTVQSAVATRYAGAKVVRAEKQVQPGKPTSYELQLDTHPKKEVTFAEDGTFVEEE